MSAIFTNVDVPGARLHYLVHAMAGDHTVVTADPRGIGGSVVEDPTQDSTPELRADDVVAILDDLGADRADVFGSSGGAVTGLALVARHPHRVRTLVAHEPPLLELLPDAAEQRAATEAIVTTFHSDGMQAAWVKFMVNAGFDMTAPDAAAVEPPQPSAQEMSDATHFFTHELRPTTRYLPDVEALRAGRVALGLGAESGRLLTWRPTPALADLMGTAPVMFPGAHGGFLSAPGAFADVLRLELGQARRARVPHPTSTA